MKNKIIKPFQQKNIQNIKILFIKGGYLFDAAGNNLAINGGSLAYYADVVYEFTVQTTYMGVTYSQLVTIQISTADALPIPNLK